MVKWSLAVDQNMGPHNGGCGTCTGLITVHNGDARSGQVDYTVEYYTMGHLTKFVKPGAFRIDSTANGTVPNVAWKNPDGSKALIAYNGTARRAVGEGQLGRPVASRTRLPTKTSATFTWSRHARPAAAAPTGPITGLGGKCVDVAGANSANGTAVQLYDCNGTAAQQWTRRRRRHRPGAGQVPGRAAAGHRRRHAGAAVRLQRHRRAAVDVQRSRTTWSTRQPNKCLDVTGNSSADGTPLQIWTCTGGANQKWTLPA